MASRISWGILFTVSGGLGIGIGTMIWLINEQQGKILNNSKVVTSAVNMMKVQEPVNQLLGEADSIDVGPASLRDGWTKLEKNKVQVRLPVKGDKDEGYLFAYARRRQQNEPFRLFKLEMTFDKVMGKKLVLLDLDEVNELDDILASNVSKKQ